MRVLRILVIICLITVIVLCVSSEAKSKRKKHEKSTDKEKDKKSKGMVKHDKGSGKKIASRKDNEDKYDTKLKTSYEKNSEERKNLKAKSSNERKNSKKRKHSKEKISKERKHSKENISKERKHSKEKHSKERKNSKEKHSKERKHSKEKHSKERKNSKEKHSKERKESKERVNDKHLKTSHEKNSKESRASKENKSSKEHDSSFAKSSEEYITSDENRSEKRKSSKEKGSKENKTSRENNTKARKASHEKNSKERKDSKEQKGSKTRHSSHEKRSKEYINSDEIGSEELKSSEEAKSSKENKMSKENHSGSKERKNSKEKKGSEDQKKPMKTHIHEITICERSSKKIQCGPGQTIKIISAMYGRKLKEVCSSKSNVVTCEAKSSMVKVNEECQGKNMCVVKAMNNVFGDPCRGTRKYLAVKYTCVGNDNNSKEKEKSEQKKAPKDQETSKEKQKIHEIMICERSSKKIQCGPGETIKIISAMYGRKLKEVCSSKSNVVTCEAKSSMVKVNEECQGKNMCVMQAMNNVFGDPCRGTRKYLAVKYTCVGNAKKESKKETSKERPKKEDDTPPPNEDIQEVMICERSMKQLQCSAGQTLKIISAMYGRKLKEVCSSKSNVVNCEAKSSLVKVQEACQDRNTCNMAAVNNVFGDPCRGTRKYLAIKYKCVSNGERYISIHTKRQTGRDYSYTHLNKYGYRLDGTSFQFTVQACNDAHIALMGDHGEKSKVYEIVIGGWANSMSVIRSTKQGTPHFRMKGKLMSCSQHRTFMITWENGVILVKYYVQNSWKVFMAWRDPAPMTVKTVGVSTGKWATGTWKIKVKDIDHCNGRKCHPNAKCANGRCVCERGYYGDGYKSCEKSCLCMASGDPHYKTYDGQMIHFMGTCRYTLTKSTNTSSECAFNVEVKNERRGGNTRVSFTRYVDVEIYGKKIRLDQGRRVFINNEKKYLPVSAFGGKLKVTSSGRYVQVWTECGVLVNFDGHHAVSVVVPSSFSKRMSGLCGDCDGTRNDFRTQDGRDVATHRSRYSMIGNSFKVQDPEATVTDTCVPIAQDDPTCDASLANLINKKEFCGEILNINGRFGKCVAKFQTLAKEFFEACVYDVCSYQGEPKEMSKVKCNAIEAFAEECEENGIIVSWREKNFCPLICEDDNMVYRTNASGCPSTCVDPEAPSTCTLEPREGCVCKDGYVLSDGKCIRLHECGCFENGEYFPLSTRKSSEDCRDDYICRKAGRSSKMFKEKSGQRCHIKAECTLDETGERKCVCQKGYEGDGYKDCKPLCGMKYKCHTNAQCRNGRCQCNRGLSGDGVRSCQAMCTCSASGDPHYRTYDGQMIHFMGVCTYLLTKSTIPSDPCSFSVFVSNERRGRNRRVAYTKSVQVDVYGKSIVMKKDRKVYVDGEEKFLPVREVDGKLSIFISGNYVRLLTACNLLVSWDGKSVAEVSVPKSYSGNLTGLCGNCNGKMDDFTTKDGKDVSKEKNRYSLIGNSYIHGPNRTLDTESCKAVEDDVKCSKEMSERAAMEDQCGYINPRFGKKSPFYDCIKENAGLATDLFKSCEYDVCAYFEDPERRTDAVCKSLEALEATCERSGFNVQWRTKTFCPIICPKNMRYSTAVSGCAATCTDPHAEDKCLLADTEGCECLPGYFLSGTECVKAEECGCYTRQGQYLPLGATFVSNDCATITKCTDVNGEAILEVQATNQRCHSDGMCGMLEGRRQCVCKDGFQGDGIKTCESLCGGLYKCHADAECQNGKCVCINGKYGDGINQCSDACVCSASGDPHYHLFDGQTVHFMGTCKYMLSKLAGIKTCNFEVQVKNEERKNLEHVSFTRMVDIKIAGQSVKLMKQRRLTVDNIEMFTPYENKKGRFYVITKGRQISLISNCGLVVSFDGVHAVSVIVPRHLGHQLSGICGNCNGKQDDLKTANGVDVSKKADKHVLIGNSYQIKNKNSCGTGNATLSCPSDSWRVRVESDEFCGKIINKTGMFRNCLSNQFQSAESFFESCRIDVCSTRGNEIKARQIVCQSYEAFADHCQVHGHLILPWRNENVCPLQCSGNEVYNPAIVGCPKTCEDPEASTPCHLAPQEGCDCKKGFVLSGNNCVMEENCGCYYNRQYYPLNATGPLTDCDQIQTCLHKDGLNKMVIVKRDVTCHSNAECKNIDGKFRCKCRPGYEGDGVKICSEPTKKQPIPEPTTATEEVTPKSSPRTLKPNPKSTPKPPPSPKPTELSSIKQKPKTSPKVKPTPSLKPKPQVKPTPRPKAVRSPKTKAPRFVTHVQCIVDVRHTSCGSSIKLKGACRYTSSFSNQCKFAVFMLKKGNKFYASVVMNKRVRVLTYGQSFSDCASVKMIGRSITITDNVCEKCTFEFVRNLMPKNSCNAP